MSFSKAIVLTTCVVAGLALTVLSLPQQTSIGAAEKSASTDWPQWRGPNRDGMSSSTGLLKKWDDGGPALAWKTSGLGSGFSSLSISNGKIFTMGEREGAQFVLALALADGKELWAAEIGPGFNASGSGPRSTPTVDGDLVYAVGPHGDLLCCEAGTGNEVWRKNFKTDFNGNRPGWGFCESVLVDGDNIICSPGSKDASIVALNKRSGVVVWKSAIPKCPTGGSGYSSIVISNGAGVKQYVQLFGSGCGCVGVRAADGKALWGYSRIGNGTASIPTTIVDGDHVFTSSGYGTGSALLKLSKDGDGVKAEEVYFLKGDEFQNHHGGMIRVGDYLFAGHGHNNGFPICLEWRTGKILWGGKERGAGSGSAAITYADGQLYFRYQNGTMALIEATTDSYKLNGKFNIPEVKGPSWSHPVVWGGKLYLREQDNLFVYQLATK
jgi:outer membrane protein assembly factor BamB